MNTNLKVIAIVTMLGATAFAVQPGFADPGKTSDSGSVDAQTAHGPHGQGMHHGTMGQGMGPGMMMHPGTMGPGMGHGMMMQPGAMGHGAMDFGAVAGRDEKDLTAADVKTIIEGRLVWSGNKRLKVGTVTKKGDDTYVAEVVTVDNSLVERLEVDRKTGSIHRVP